MSGGPVTRVARLDALRGLAVFGIMLVNIWGFVYGFGLISFPAGADILSGADKAAIFFSAAVAEQKFYPIFSFLFGAGFALQTGGAQRDGPVLLALQARYRRRLSWLLVCGMAHATLLWFGDILVAYALTGFWLATKVGARPAALVRSFKWLIGINLFFLLMTATIYHFMGQMSKEDMAQELSDSMRAHAIYTTGTWTEIALQRLIDFLSNVISFVIILPRVALLFMLGVLATRLGWLRQPERHRPFWRRVLTIGLVVGIPINCWWGLVALNSALDPTPNTAYGSASAALIDVAGPLLGAAYVAMFMLAGPRVMRVLEPVGRMALSNYLMQSLLMMLLLQGFGLGLGAHLSRAGMLGVALAIMLFQLAFSHWWLARHPQGPMEALWRRYTYRGAAGAKPSS